MKTFLNILLSSLITLAASDTFSVKIGVDQHVNVVDERFMSFTIDPKYLFSNSDKFKSNECLCMATALAPAFIRIAGPSTSSMTFQNATISITEDFSEERRDPQNRGKLSVSHRKWKKFIQWAKSTGFDLVFALNNEERTSSGMWDPNTALSILTVAEKTNVADIFWQLGYECNGQSIEEYLNDMETLRVIIETFAPGREGTWRVVGGDVSNCLEADSKSDFKDYVTLSDDMMDAIMLNGNSSSYELTRMSEPDRLKLLKRLSQSATPLWLTEYPRFEGGALERAADWLSSLGYSARNGFSVHFREVLEGELYEPDLSFYMALLFKNLVGERVLDVELESDRSVLFAHCTSLRHKAVPGAVTIYGINMDDEVARFSIKMGKREEGGDIMQFIIGQDFNGNIIVNGRAMYHEGDIKPVVKRVRPYKTLIINLPPKSFGFWVLANTNVEACRDPEESKDQVERITVSDSVEESEEYIRKKRLADLIRDTNINYKKNVKTEDEMKNLEKPIKFYENIETNKDKYVNYINNQQHTEKKSLTISNNDNKTSEIGNINPDEISDKSKDSENNLDTFNSAVLDLDTVTNFKAELDDNVNLEGKINSLNNDFHDTQRIIENNKYYKKRNVDEDTNVSKKDTETSSSVSRKTNSKIPEDRIKKRKISVKSARFQPEESRPSKLMILRSKFGRKYNALGRSSILDTILAKRNARIRESGKYLLGKDKLNKKTSRISKRGQKYKQNKPEGEDSSRARRTTNEENSQMKQPNNNSLLNKRKTRVRRSVSEENETNKGIRERAYTSDENTYSTGAIEGDKLTETVKIKTLRNRKLRNQNVYLENQVKDFKSNIDESELMGDSKEENTQGFSRDKKTADHRPHLSRSIQYEHNKPRNTISRNARNAIGKGIKLPVDMLENEILDDDIENPKLWKILRKIRRQLKDLSNEGGSNYEGNIDEQVIEPNASNEDSGLIKSTVNNLMKALREVNKNLNKFLNGVNLLD